MPRYDFECNQCHHIFELELKISQKDGIHEKKVCPQCSHKELTQLMTFKGGISTQSSSTSSSKSPMNSSCATGMCPFARG